MLVSKNILNFSSPVLLLVLFLTSNDINIVDYSQIELFEEYIM